MTTEWLSTSHVEDIGALIAGCKFPDDALFLGTQQPAQVVRLEDRQDLLLFVPFDPDLPFAKFASGRIFNRDFELRWQQDDGGSQVVYLGTPEYRPGALSESEPIDMESPRYYYLFGTPLQPEDVRDIGKPAREGDFAEVRVPRLLRYPIQGAKRRVKIAVCESIDKQTGEVTQYRFQGIEEAGSNEPL